MALTFYVVLGNCVGFAILAVQHYFSHQKQIHFMTDIKSQLTAARDQFNKAYGEIGRKIERLTKAIENNGDKLSPESQAILDELTADAAKFDAVVDDAEDQANSTGGDQTNTGSGEQTGINGNATDTQQG